jgi:hypothetical protein
MMRVVPSGTEYRRQLFFYRHFVPDGTFLFTIILFGLMILEKYFKIFAGF